MIFHTRYTLPPILGRTHYMAGSRISICTWSSLVGTEQTQLSIRIVISMSQVIFWTTDDLICSQNQSGNDRLHHMALLMFCRTPAVTVTVIGLWRLTWGSYIVSLPCQNKGIKDSNPAIEVELKHLVSLWVALAFLNYNIHLLHRFSQPPSSRPFAINQHDQTYHSKQKAATTHYWGALGLSDTQ